MNACMARKGFLTLSDCGSMAVTMCSNCGRAMCPAHLAPQSGFTMCLDCAATNLPQDQTNGYDDVWARRYRNDYYSSTGYTPAGSGTPYYDSSDTGAFNDRQRDADEDDVDRGGFGAS
jgi:hypothetical protein